MKALKPPLSYIEQVNHLKTAHGLKIEDENQAIKILKQVNYYRLSGYGIGLTEKENREVFKSGVSLQQIYDLYCFDSLIKNQLIHALELVEIQLRSQISYALAMHYGADGYYEAKNFLVKKKKSGITVHQDLLNKFQNEVKRQRRLPFVKHHLEIYGGRFPIWVAVELFTFGMLASLYHIMKPELQKEIADVYKTEPKYLNSWILSLVEVRNICAHYSRLYNMPLKQTPFLYKEHRQYRFGKINKLFPVLLVLRRILNADKRWKQVYDNLCAIFEKYENIYNLSFMGFPKNWNTILTL